ncbi:MAG: type VII secretion-associated serine protease mycosin [Mycobacteriaceae bacterium]|nr:type VII secretion-associated serine protease mycosin [Mycobacteriaceae bacterium]
MIWVRPARRYVLTLAAVVAVTVWACPSALAIGPPVVDPTVQPPSGAVGPVESMAQRGECVIAGVLEGTDPQVSTLSQEMLNLTAAWQFSRGENQTVAVIDTGVSPGPRLPNVDGGGDYLASTNGLTDCDGHGTLVAGIIAGQPGEDGFSGVAPAARVLAIRAVSKKFSPRSVGTGDPMLARVSLDIDVVSRAIVHAADLGARVITVATALCVPADRNIDQSGLGAALRYAAIDKDAVVVAAAGDSEQTGSDGGGSCESNPITDLSHPGDPRNWAGVASISIPSWWQPYVLSVGSLAADGGPSRFTMAGPWVGIAAPGENLVSVSNGDGGGLANGLPNDRKHLAPLNGTGYAAGYVSGVAALVRSKYPDLTAVQVVQRITATAHRGARAPSNIIGTGTVDPAAALTWTLPAGATPDKPSVRSVVAPVEPAPKDRRPVVVAFAGTAVLAVLVAVVAAIAVVRARRKEESTC